MLSIVANPEGNVVHIHGDVSGLLALEREIRRLREHAEQVSCQDGHLFTQAWGGVNLTETMLDNERGEGWHQVHHVKLFSWSVEWSTRHGLSPAVP
ncbi:Imm32 family immunity protein [Xanthomonas arboricola]|uniref:Uncharacterized protein n=1 Tax=Xanthomonas arboricola TaxID=56448 RepID=A0AAU9HMV2_9XANT|nr:Imm32 family immunity protein [Xanthomonas arboricola]NJB78621.1 hypothetical protein [Xanthomonas arboricola]CAE6698985.1 hypothetical protein XA1314C_03760 [Xanthomonas arboricola]CAE6699000.1 hypothetical protein XA1314C_03760 [Xanthomonas arboricola]